MDHSEVSDGNALYSESHCKIAYSFRREVLYWFMFKTPIGKWIWRPTLEDDMLVYRPFWRL